MAQDTWATCPEAVRTQVETLTETFERLLSKNLIGVYLHGSLALGGFNVNRSDVDLLVVTKIGMDDPIKIEVARAILTASNQPCPIEISFLRTADLHPWQHPTPFDFHFSKEWHAKTQADVDSGKAQKLDVRDADLAAHVTVTRHVGIVLVGKPIDEVFPPVPREHYVQSIVGDAEDAPEHITENPVYHVLNPCRVYRYLLDGVVCSKDEAGAWAQAFLPEVYRGLVRQAHRIYRGEIPGQPFDADDLRQFAAYMIAEIRALVSKN
ncbi:MAG: DUF4111 domain-containing protein [Anaerolineae bacterium]|nr:DUF4111 domain-containing protein [Anaerolineae bacterium]